MSLHLGGNPGVTDLSVLEMNEMLDATHDPLMNLMTFNQMINHVKGKEYAKNDNPNKGFSYAFPIKGRQEVMMMKKLNTERRLYQPLDDGAEDDHLNRQMIYTRILGHSLEMPGSSGWQLMRDKKSQCWVCD